MANGPSFDGNSDAVTRGVRQALGLGGSQPSTYRTPATPIRHLNNPHLAQAQKTEPSVSPPTQAATVQTMGANLDAALAAKSEHAAMQDHLRRILMRLNAMRANPQPVKYGKRPKPNDGGPIGGIG